MTLHYTNHQNLTVYLKHLEEAAPHPNFKDSRRKGNRDWAQYNWEDSQKAAKFGSQYHRDKVIAVRDRLLAELPELSEQQEQIIWDVAPGMAFDMARVLEGEPEQWFSLVPRPVEEFTIVVNGVYNCSVQKSRIERAGAAIAALVEVLQQRGIGVRVQRVECYTSGQTIYANADPKSLIREYTNSHKLIWLNAITVQQPDSPADPDALAYWIGSSDALRRQSFAAAERLPPHLMEELGGGYGRSASVMPMREVFPEWGAGLNGQELILDTDFMASNPAFDNEVNAVEWLKSQVLKYTTTGVTDGTLEEVPS